MVDVTTIHIHYWTFAGKRSIKRITPSDPTNMLSIKSDIGEAVKKLRDSGKYEYYYVIIEIDKDGKPAYRPVIPKTLL